MGNLGNVRIFQIRNRLWVDMNCSNNLRPSWMSSEMGECRVIRQDCKWMCLKFAVDKNLETPRLCRFPSFFFWDEMKQMNKTHLSDFVTFLWVGYQFSVGFFGPTWGQPWNWWTWTTACAPRCGPWFAPIFPTIFGWNTMNYRVFIGVDHLTSNHQPRTCLPVAENNKSFAKSPSFAGARSPHQDPQRTWQLWWDGREAWQLQYNVVTGYTLCNPIWIWQTLKPVIDLTVACLFPRFIIQLHYLQLQGYWRVGEKLR